MKYVGIVAYLVILVWASYKVGNRGAGYGIALFVAGLLAYSLVVNGPQSLFRGDDCSRYSSIADDC